MNNTYGIIKGLAMVFLCLFFSEAKAQVGFPSFYLAPKESYVKAMKTVFEDIYDRKWDKAQKDYAKLEEKSKLAKQKNPGYANTQMDALYPLPQLAMAMILSTEGTNLPDMPLDYNKAYYLLKKALRYDHQKELKSFLSSIGTGVNLDMLEDRIESNMCKKATALNTEKGYDAIVDSLLPQSLYLEKMKTQREALAFSNVMKAPTVENCERFLNRYSDALVSRRNTISNKIDSIHFSALDGSILSLRDYIENYPNSSYLQRAKDSLLMKEYRTVDTTALSCRNFLKKYPDSKFSLEVEKKLQKYAIRDALQQCSGPAYMNFCREFPYDLHYEQILDSLLYSSVREAYDSVFANKRLSLNKILSSAFFQTVKNRDAADQKMKESSLIPPRRRNMWTGVLAGSNSKPYNYADIIGIDIKSKTNASVHVLLSDAPTKSAMVKEVQQVQDSMGTKAKTQTDLYIDYIFEDDELKIDDIRLDSGKTSQKNGGA